MNTPTIEPVQRLYEDPTHSVGDKDAVSFHGVGHIDHDDALGFQLRGHSYNPMIDAAMPLLGLTLRIRKLEEFENVAGFYDRVRDQIAAVNAEVRKLGYDHGSYSAFSYSLCAFLDEVVMATKWGSQSMWAARSLLSAQHQETWGGEKFFTVLSRLSARPQPSRDVLEFMYLCLCLGFKGKYMLQHNGEDELQRVIENLHRILRAQRGQAPDRLTDAQSHVAPRHYRHNRSLPWWIPWAVAAGVLVSAYLIYSVRLGMVSNTVLQALDHVLAR